MSRARSSWPSSRKWASSYGRRPPRSRRRSFEGLPKLSPILLRAPARAAAAGRRLPAGGPSRRPPGRPWAPTAAPAPRCPGRAPRLSRARGPVPRVPGPRVLVPRVPGPAVAARAVRRRVRVPFRRPPCSRCRVRRAPRAAAVPGRRRPPRRRAPRLRPCPAVPPPVRAATAAMAVPRCPSRVLARPSRAPVPARARVADVRAPRVRATTRSARPTPAWGPRPSPVRVPARPPVSARATAARAAATGPVVRVRPRRVPVLGPAVRVPAVAAVCRRVRAVRGRAR
ncbi:hypothetical protein SAMN04489712_107244 [Thermomonospora echinospora]|uniref:Uncharacterized protein n=1 Tax=Thermomonospora echinospora TaxID=1992 RepID=A0A1H6BMW2_9ACTN|nr:hypothetical protein SAMN04489712_107244 [Thermomonospora echinospora]